MVYTPKMATIDENTHFKPGISSGPADQIRISNELPDGLTVLQFVHYLKVTDDHVDEAEIVGDIQMNRNDLRSLSKLLQDRIG